MSNTIESPSRSAAMGPPCAASGRHVTRHQAVGCTGEAAVGQQRDGIAQARADQRRGHAEHFAHARPAFRSLVANHHDVVVFDLARLHGCEGVFLAVEHPRRTR